MALTVQALWEITGIAADAGPESPTGEKRRGSRIPLRIQSAMVPLSGKIAGRPTRGRVRDISMTGTGLWCDKPVPAGEFFAMRLERPGAEAVWVRCRVVRCDEVQPNLFFVGAEFKDVIDIKAFGSKPRT